MSVTLPTRTGYGDLTVYRTEAAAVAIDLSDNTNLFGSAPSALAVLRDWASRSPARYPTLVTERLRQGIADWLGVAPDQLIPGCGSNDVLDSAMRALGEPGSEVAFASPTFVMARHFAIANTLVPRPVPTAADGTPDIDGLLATGARLIYLASPNNPSGRTASAAAVERLLDRAPGYVILDEAYAEYAGRSAVPGVIARENVLVTRTFSKAWGLAGLRLGFGVGARSLVTEIEKARGPYKVNAVAEEAAAAAVETDRRWLADVVAKTVAARTATLERLRALGFRPWDSEANFIAVPVADARLAADHLAARGIAVRGFPGTPVLGDLLRVTIGPESVMEPFLSGMAELAR